MRFLLHLTVATLLMACGLGGMTSAAAADREARAAVMGRQKILAELSAAMEKGYLTRMDQYHILLHAKGVLNADDLHGLERTLDRIATQQATRRATNTATRSAALVRQSADNREPPTITRSQYEETQTADLPIVGDPAPAKSKHVRETPFIEEIPTGVGQRISQLEDDDPEGCGCDPEECQPCRRWFDLDFFSSVDAFKGPVDVADANGNFGVRMGVNAAVSLLPRLGVGFQLGTAAVLSNLKGSPFPEPNATIRDQFFTTAGMFQRINREGGAFTWGFAYDWLFDDYYTNFHFGQWRVKAAYEFDPCDEIGIAAAMPEHGSTGFLPNLIGGIDELHFKPVAQGYLYWKHTWCNEASLAGRAGVAERPGEFLFGGESRVPLTQNLALTGGFNYIMPLAAGGAIAQTQEMWNVSVGIEIVPGGFSHGCAARFQPFLPVADNGSLAVRELGGPQ